MNLQLERELRQHGASLQALAAALLGDSADADDAVQDTWLLAMQRPPRSPGALSGWLHVVLRTVASKLRRAGRRRQRRERAAARGEALPGTDVLLEQRETLRTVLDAVLGLPEPYRTAVWQRFFTGSKPAAIAAQTGEPLATVKCRLQRGLVLLRQRLDCAERGGRWRQALRGAVGLEGLTPASGAAATFSTGVLLMGIGGKLALGGAAAALAVVAVWVSFGDRDAPAPMPGTPVPAESAEMVVQGRGTAPGAVGRTRDRAPERQKIATPLAASGLAPFTAVVVDADTGQPVAGARVEVVENAALVRALAAAGTTMHAPAGRRLRAGLAIVATTDDAGTAAMQVPDGALLVEARHSARWGFLAVNRQPEDHRVVLPIGFDRDLRVRVVDQEGKPCAGVPVALRRQSDPEPRVRWSGQDTVTELPDGVAVFLHFQRRLQLGPGWHLTFAFPLAEQPAVPVDAGTPQQPPRELRLPPVGGLRLQVRTRDGSVPFLGGVEVKVKATAGGPPLYADAAWAHPRLDQDSGEAVVPWLGLGLQLQVELLRAGTVVATASAAGPQRAGETVDCVMLWDRPAVRTVRGRFLRQDGRPWPAGTAEALARLSPMPADLTDQPEAQPLAVAGDGRFALEIRHPRPPGGSRRYQFTAPHPDGSGSAMAFVGLDQDVPREGLDLGDVVLDHGPLLVAGRVVDSGGRPVVGAQVRLRAFAAALAEERWRSVFPSGTLRTGADGTFALFLPPGELDPGDRLALTTHVDGYVPERNRECARGDARLLIVLQPAGALAGSFAFDRGLGADDLTVWLAAAAAPADLRLVPVRRDGSFVVEQLPAGRYTLRVFRAGLDNRPESQPAVAVDGLLVQGSTENRDPRIQQLRIETVHPTVCIEVVDRNSTPLPGAMVTLAGARQPRPAVADAAGVCRVRAERLPVDVEVSAFGHRPRRLLGVVADARVVLDDGLTVRLRAGVLPSERQAPHRLGVVLYDVDAGGVRRAATYGTAWPWQLRYFDPVGELAVKLPRPGVYECDPFVYLQGDDRVGRVVPVSMQPPVRITVVESDRPQVFDLGITQAAVEAAARTEPAAGALPREGSR